MVGSGVLRDGVGGGSLLVDRFLGGGRAFWLPGGGEDLRDHVLVVPRDLVVVVVVLGEVDGVPVSYTHLTLPTIYSV